MTEPDEDEEAEEPKESGGASSDAPEIMGDPVGITAIFIHNFLNAASPDPNSRIVGLKNILTLAAPYVEVKFPDRPNWSTMLRRAKARLPKPTPGLEASLDEDAIRSGSAQRLYDEEYEDLLRVAVVEAMKKLKEAGLLSWNEMLKGGRMMVPTKDMGSFRGRSF